MQIKQGIIIKKEVKEGLQNCLAGLSPTLSLPLSPLLFRKYIAAGETAEIMHNLMKTLLSHRALAANINEHIQGKYADY